MEELDQVAAEPAKRPTFLTVLCILTFLCSGGWYFGGGLMKAATYEEGVTEENYIEGIEMTRELAETQDMPWLAESLTDEAVEQGLIMESNGVPVGLNMAFFGLLCVLGAVLMWNSRKLGFWIYIGGSLLVLVYPTTLVGFEPYGLGATVVMVILYGINFKHLK